MNQLFIWKALFMATIFLHKLFKTLTFGFTFFLVALVSPVIGGAQIDQQYWHYGITNKGLFFDASSSYAVSVTTNSYTPYGAEHSSVVSDPVTGELKFYTDGLHVVDNTHQLMPNGGGLVSHSSNFSSGKVCQMPGDCDKYYIIHSAYAIEDGITLPLRYTVVDMSLPGNGTMAAPLGDVVLAQKNIVLCPNASESMEIVPKANSHDFWLLAGKNGLNTIEVYLITSSGIAFSSSYAVPIVMNNTVSMDYCHENGKIALCSYQEMYPTLITDFDDATGTFSGTAAIPGTPWGASTLNWQGTFDTEWSPDGTKLYISKYRNGATSGGRLYQYDLNTPLVAPVLIHSVGTSNNAVARGITLAPDGKIYMMWKPASGAVLTVHVVNNPNNAGLACGFVANALNMGGDIGNTHLFPDFPYWINSIPAIPDSTLNFSCQLPTSISFDPLDGYTDVEGDNLSFVVNTSVGGTSSITGTMVDFTVDPGFSGIPYVEIIYSDDYCFPKTDTFIVEMVVSAGSGTLGLPDSTIVCASGPVLLDAGAGFITYTWSTGDVTQQISPAITGNYSVETSDGICSYFDSTYVLFSTVAAVTIGPDQLVCANNLELSVDPFNGSVTWSNGVMFSDNVVSNSGTYSVIGSDVNGCLSYDTINVVINPLPIINLGPDQIICNYDIVYLEAIGFATVLWSNGDLNDSLLADQTGNYSVTVTNSFGCQSTDSVAIVVAVPLEVDLGPDVEVCADNYTISVPGFFSTMFWSDGHVGLTNQVTLSGTYGGTALDMNGCISSDSVQVQIIPVPFIDLGPDIVGCPGEITLSAPGFSSVLWSDGTSGTSLLVSGPGTYSVEVANEFGCIAGDVVAVSFIDASVITLGPDIESCDLKELTLVTGVSQGDFLWSTGATESELTINESGTYWIEQSVCGNLVYDTVVVELTGLDQNVYVPNAFTPDGNEINNEFAVVFGDYSHIIHYDLAIYNRWGEQIYHTNDPFSSWDGTGNIGLLATGVYTYLIQIESDCQENQHWTQYGHIVLLR